MRINYFIPHRRSSTTSVPLDDLVTDAFCPSRPGSAELRDLTTSGCSSKYATTMASSGSCFLYAHSLDDLPQPWNQRPVSR